MTDVPLTARPESELLALLGKELLGDGIGYGPEDPGRYRRFAERWIEERLDRIQAAICDDAGLRVVFSKEMENRLNDVGAVADALSAIAGRPPLTLLAVILLRRGYESVCEG
jgi:hypothetical protein